MRRRRSRTRAAPGLALALALLGGCEDPAPAPSPRPAPPAPVAPVEEERALHLEVAPRLIARARREAAGLRRMPPGLREQTLARRAEERGPSYAELRADAEAHAEASVVFDGEVGFIGPAGPRLWIIALQTRRRDERWVDPLYVLSTAEPTFAQGTIARIHAWVVGERTIGRHTLPLVLAYSVERLDPARAPPGDRP